MARVLIHNGIGIPQFKAPKDPDSVVDYAVPWGDWLQAGESIAAVEWDATVFTIDSSASAASAVINGETHSAVEVVWLSGGTIGQVGTVRCRVTTDQGRTEDRSFRLLCAEK